MIFWICFSYFVSHSWGIPMMKITGLSHLFKWENLHNWWLTKYFFAPLYVCLQMETFHWVVYSAWGNSRAMPCATGVMFSAVSAENNRAPSTLRVYIAAISAQHAFVNGQLLGSHNLVTFLKGAQRLRPTPIVRCPSWDLSLVLKSLTLHPSKHIEQGDLKWISWKTAFRLAIASAKHVGELHALSVSESCMHWNADKSVVTLWPNPSFLPKRMSALFKNQAIELTALNPTVGGAQDGNHTELLCPVRALKDYLRATENLRHSDQLFICYGGPKKGQPLVKTETIALGVRSNYTDI